MWVRIDEISLLPDRAEDVVDHVRNTAVIRHDGDGFRGFRLLVDQRARACVGRVLLGLCAGRGARRRHGRD